MTIASRRAIMFHCFLLLSFANATTPRVGVALASQEIGSEKTPNRKEREEQVRRRDFRDPNEVKRTAEVVYIKSRTGFLKHAALADALEKRKDFQALGLVITENESSADIIIEIEREHLLAHFIYTVYDPGTRTVVASGHVSSLFGTAAGKIADSFVKQMKRARIQPAEKPRK